MTNATDPKGGSGVVVVGGIPVQKKFEGCAGELIRARGGGTLWIYDTDDDGRPVAVANVGDLLYLLAAAEIEEARLVLAAIAWNRTPLRREYDDERHIVILGRELELALAKPTMSSDWEDAPYRQFVLNMMVRDTPARGTYRPRRKRHPGFYRRARSGRR